LKHALEGARGARLNGRNFVIDAWRQPARRQRQRGCCLDGRFGGACTLYRRLILPRWGALFGAQARALLRCYKTSIKSRALRRLARSTGMRRGRLNAIEIALRLGVGGVIVDVDLQYADRTFAFARFG
jgi:hypothetical protein